MKVQDLFERLSFGELSSLSIGMEGAGGIEPSKQDSVIAKINNALTGVYSRFIHQRDFLTVAAEAGKRRYQIAPPEGVVKILSVVRLDDPETTRIDERLTMGINSRNSSDGIQILNHDTFFLSAPKEGDRYEVEYQANHPRLTSPEDDIVVMPALEEALQARVAAAIFSGMGGEGHRARSQELMVLYEQRCAEAQAEDMAQEGGDDHFDRLRDKGFV